MPRRKRHLHLSASLLVGLSISLPCPPSTSDDR